VQLLTVHGAKGLEARTVILMDSDAPAAKADTATLLVDWPVEREAPLRCAFVASEARCAPGLQALLQREQAAREREELNGLYVAMTRAREQLLLSAVVPHQRAHAGSWWARIAPFAPAWQAPATPATQQVAADQAVSYLSLPAFDAGPSSSSQIPTPEARSDEAKLGEALHRVLEWATNGTDMSLSTLANAAASAFGLDEAARTALLNHASTVLDSPAVRRFLDRRALAWAGNEVSLTDADGIVRLDRLVAMEQGGRRVWWVLDYKLQSAPHTVPAYNEQLGRYRALVQRLQPSDEVRAAFVTAAGEVIELPA
jgi:ATP-dependent helicase/nuclease subunit A